MMDTLSTQNQKPETKVIPTSGLLPQKVSRFGLSVKSGTSLEPVAPTPGRKRMDASKPAGTVLTSNYNIKLEPYVKAVTPASQYKREDSANCIPEPSLAKAESKDDRKHDPFAMLMAPATWYKGKEILSYGTPPISNPRRILEHREGVAPLTPNYKGEAPTLDWSISTTAGSYSELITPAAQQEVEDILALKTFSKTSGPEFQFQNTANPKVSVSTSQYNGATGALSTKDTVPSFDDSFENLASSPLHREEKEPESHPQRIPRSGLDIKPGSSPGAGPVRGSSGYSFVTGSRFAIVAKTESNDEKHCMESSGCKSRMTIPSHSSSGTNVKRLAASLVRSGAVPAISPSIEHIIQPSVKEAPAVVLLQMTPEARIAETRNNMDQIMPNLPDDEESDHDISSNDESKEEEGDELREVGNLDDIALVGSKPFNKRITARRRIRQGEFSKW